jgi:hypothetical protein
VERVIRQTREKLALLTARGQALRARKAMLVRLFGDADAPSEDGRKFMLMLADMAAFGATDIAPTERDETARAAKRALVNQLLVAWHGDPHVMARLRADQARLEENFDE